MFVEILEGKKQQQQQPSLALLMQTF